MLAVVYGMEKFHHYMFGRELNVMTDHKPIIAITSKRLSCAPKRLQNLLLRAQKYDYKLTWKPGTKIPLADALSRAPTDEPCEDEVVNFIMEHCISDEHRTQIRGGTATDQVLAALKVIKGGMARSQVQRPARTHPVLQLHR